MDLLYTSLIEPFSYAFMYRALIMGLLVSVVCAVLSCYLVLKGWALMGDAISHAVLPGIGLAYVLSIPLLIGAFLAATLCSIMIGFIKDNCRLKEDAVMGIVFSGLFALGLVMLTSIETDVHLLHVLFGNLLGVNWHDIVLSAAIAMLVVAVLYLKRQAFILYCFDASYAEVINLPNRLMHYALLLMLSLSIVAAIEAVGILLVIALLIVPGAVAHLLCQRFDRMLLVAVTSAVISSVAGLIISFHANVATAPVIVILQVLLFVILALRSRPSEVKL